MLSTLKISDQNHRLRGSLPRKPCATGDTSFLWEPRVTFWLFPPQP